MPRDVDAAEWIVNPRAAVARQRELAPRVETRDRFRKIRHVAGIDAGFPDGGRTTRVVISVMSFPALELVEEVVTEQPTRIPYIPGLLSFREVPVMYEAFARLTTVPEIVLCDGHGRAHPRRFGSASHLGLACDVATIGVGKSRLCGAHDDPGMARGQCEPLEHKSEVIGAVLRTRDKVKPVYVSIGHRISLDSAIKLVLACAPRFRLPEPIRAADKLASMHTARRRN